MQYCELCGQQTSVKKDTPCKKCSGLCFVEEETKPGIKTRTACGRCNGSGLEIRNVSRRNRSRGNATENQFAKKLQAWWRVHCPTAEFARTPSSGGSKLKDGWGLRGDITTNDPTFPFFIECKKEKGWDFGDLLGSEKGGRLGDYIRQVIRENTTHSLSLIRFSHPGPSQPEYVMVMTFAVVAGTANADELMARASNALCAPDSNYAFSRTVVAEDKISYYVTGFVVRSERLFSTNPTPWTRLTNEPV